MMNHQLQSSMQVSTGSNPGGGFVPLGITQIRLLQGLAAAAASKNFVPADHSSAFVSPSISKPRKSGASYNKYCHFCQHVKVKRVDSMFACRNKHCSRCVHGGQWLFDLKCCVIK